MPVMSAFFFMLQNLTQTPGTSTMILHSFKPVFDTLKSDARR